MIISEIYLCGWEKVGMFGVQYVPVRSSQHLHTHMYGQWGKGCWYADILHTQTDPHAEVGKNPKDDRDLQCVRHFVLQQTYTAAHTHTIWHTNTQSCAKARTYTHAPSWDLQCGWCGHDNKDTLFSCVQWAHAENTYSTVVQMQDIKLTKTQVGGQKWQTKIHSDGMNLKHMFSCSLYVWISEPIHYTECTMNESTCYL